MKQKLLIAIFACCLFVQNTYSQTGYIYVHLKHVNEEASPNYSFTLKNSSGTTLNAFTLNDQPSADNATFGSYVYIYDIGEGHGTGGDGQLWVVGGATWGNLQASNTLSDLSGTIYYRNASSSAWVTTSITGVRNIDGAYANQCVYTTSGGKVVFYNNGTPTTIYTGTDAWDVTANGGKIAITTTGGAIKVYANAYTSSTSPATGGTWNTVNSPGSITQLDMNVTGTTIAFLSTGSTTPKTVAALTSGTATPVSLASFSSQGNSYNPWDIAYDDSSYIYISGGNSNAGLVGIYSSSTTAATAWNYESRSGDVSGITAGAGRSVFGVQTQLTSPAAETIFGRFTDKTGTAYWVDDDRVKSTSTVSGNGIMIAVSPGTYTLTETLPGTSYDLGRFNIYDPQGNSTGNVNTQTITFVVAQNEVVFGEYVNEKLNPKAIALTCNFQYLQTFDASNSSPLYGTTTFGSGTYGTNVEGTSYHYWNQAHAHDGYYFLIKNETGSQWFTNDSIVDHTKNGGYFLLVNASFQADEFYRQRVTNLVKGLSYSITFWAANASPTATTLQPNITFGLQDTLGQYLSPTTTGNITSSTWKQYNLTFTATTSTADLFLSNNGIGGNGNDIAIDDIAINPVITPLGNITVSPTIAPNVCIGTNYNFSNSQSGGVWTTSPSTVATVKDANRGKIQGIAPGNATVTYSYTNAIGCTSTTSTGIIVSAPPTVTTSDLLGGTSCLNQTDSLFSTASSGTTPYTYAWTELSGTSTGGLSTATIPNTTATPTAAGTYTYLMTVTDAVGCTGTGSVVLTVAPNTAPTVTAGISSSPYCANSAINLTSSATGGSGSYTYTWSASPTGNGLGTTTTQNTTATPTAAGTYTYKIVVKDGFCNVPKTVSATVNAAPSVTVAGPTGTQQLCSNASFALTSTPSGGSGTYTYAWTGSKVSGPDNGPGLQSPTTTQNVTAKPTLTLSTVLNPDVYKYSLIVTDGNGCTASGSTNVTAYLNALANAPTVSITSPTSATIICLGSTFSLTATAAAGLGTTISSYSWTGPGSYTSSTLSPGTITPAAAGTGTYTLTVTEANGCKASATSAAVTVNPSPSVVASSFAATLCSNTVDSVYATASGGTAPYSYAWTSNSSSGGFNITSTSNDTSAVTGGSNNTTYTLTMTVTDAKSCKATSTTTVKKVNSSGPTLTVTPSANGTICINTATTLTGTPSGGSTPYTYAWSATGSGNTFSAPTASSTTVNPSVAGSYTYSLKVTDNNSCAVQANSGKQTVNSPLVVTTTADAPGFCGNNSSVNLVASPTGGSGTYTKYTWTTAVKVSPGTTTVSPTSSTTTGVTTATISGATVNTSKFQYFAVVMDNAGCTGSDSSDILVVGSTPTFTTAPTATISSACVGQTFNLSSAPFTGGTSSYNYSWTAPTGVTVANATGTVTSSPIPATTAPASVAGNYNFGLLVVDGNNCKLAASITAVPINPVPVITLASDNYSVCKTPATTINLTGSLTPATTSPYRYDWTGSGVTTSPTSSNTNTAVPTTTGTYSVTVTDGNGCTGAGSTSTVTVNNSPAITASANKTVACATPATTVNLTGNLTTSTTSPYNYSWAGSGVVAANSLTTTAIPTAAGTYTITVTDGNGCTATGTTTNVAYDALIATVTFSNCNTNNAGVKYGQLNEANGSTWLWTTVDGGRFYTSNALSVATDSSTSHIQAPFITFLGTYNVAITDGNNCTASGSVTVNSSSCSGSVILAVNNLSFTAQKQGNNVQLDWKTSTEINNDHFDVERSSDGANWQVIGTVKGHGNSTTTIKYGYTDALPLNGLNYYRLKQTDADGKFAYSQVKTVQFTGQWLVKLYPNPVKGFMVLEFNNDREEKGAIVIQTMAGNTIFATEKQLLKGLNRITLNQVQPLAQGTYMVILGTQNNIFRSKFVKTGN